MGKTKAQLRAEAVERLRDTDAWLSTSADLINAMLGDRCEVGMANKRRYFIDLLTDDEPPEGDAVAIMRKVATCGECTGYTMRKEVGGIDWADALLILADMVERDYVRRDSLTDDEPQDGTTPEFDVPLYGWHEGDTRGKLEEDVRQYANPEGNTGTLGACWERKMIGFLDRQAAITRAECDKPNWDYCETCEQLKAMQNEIAELKADNDYLRDINEKLGREVRDWKGEAKNQRNNFEQATEARKHWQRKYENLKATSYSAEEPSDESELARELGEALAERDMYRDKLGRAIDAAHEIVRMVDE